MTAIQVIQSAIPEAPKELCDFILWNHSPFPFDSRARSLYKAADRFRRASANNRKLCCCCNNQVLNEDLVCDKCRKALKGIGGDDQHETR